jgi:hypothetical protein
MRTLDPDTQPSNDCQEVRDGNFAVESILIKQYEKFSGNAILSRNYDLRPE